jgi:RHS repeat-associated protein
VITTFTYDYHNRLTEVTQGGTVIATYTYDAVGRRIGFDDNGTQTWTVYDGNTADDHPYADFNGSGTLLYRYVFGPGVLNGAAVDQILGRIPSGSSTPTWYLTDRLGTVRDIVSGQGTELDHVVYDSFGNVASETNAANGDRFKYAGMEYDATTSQYYDRARYYDEAIGRFMRQDPIGFRSRDTNLYRYVNNAATAGTDPSGLIHPIVVGAISGLVYGVIKETIDFAQDGEFSLVDIAVSTAFGAGLGALPGFLPPGLFKNILTTFGYGETLTVKQILLSFRTEVPKDIFIWVPIYEAWDALKGVQLQKRSSCASAGAYRSYGGYANPGYAGGCQC